MKRLLPKDWLTWTRRLLLTTAMLSMLGLSNGCAARVVVIPADREVIPLPAGKVFKPSYPGWFVPDARMQEILQALERSNPK